ncbi:RNA-binding region-containing protein 3-like isoform X2 [Lycorma delicatula]|uniref:RNA-binding region-containing protein 3-like isoform X2 n=1 Tax=Lycorma delicatula TaxID=130591 RepID=UPI003F5175A6
MVASDTLLIRHMPAELSVEEKEDFLKHFGAVSVKIINSKYKKSNNVFAVISDESKEKRSRKYYENFLYRLNSWSSAVDFNIPPPVHLKYQYPPPSRNVLENIAKTLAVVPKFYTQVLHLMNKMNLPCPFTNQFPIKTNMFDNIIGKRADCISESEGNLAENVKTSRLSDEESELESENDENFTIINEIIPSKRALPDKKRKVKRPKFIKPITTIPTQASKNSLKTEEVFEVSEKEPQMRKIEVKITPDLSSIHEAEETQKTACPVEGFEILPANEITSSETQGTTAQATEEEESISSCITEQELAANRIPARDQRILPVFKNYQPGAPSCRLYIKNLAKQVQTKDLYYIYKRYFIPDQEEQGTMFDVRLMQEGRMKGQAFINFQSVELAQKALKETNGFILKDKPMVVQFARSSKAK